MEESGCQSRSTEDAPSIFLPCNSAPSCNEFRKSSQSTSKGMRQTYGGGLSRGVCHDGETEQPHQPRGPFPNARGTKGESAGPVPLTSCLGVSCPMSGLKANRTARPANKKHLPQLAFGSLGIWNWILHPLPQMSYFRCAFSVHQFAIRGPWYNALFPADSSVERQVG